jgi:hypothetical protein
MVSIWLLTTMAAIDRLVHHAMILEFNGESVSRPEGAGTGKRPGPPARRFLPQKNNMAEQMTG